MADYTVASNNTQHFSLRAGGRVLGELTYKSWFSFESTITLTDHSQFAIKPKGFWGTTIELRQGDATLLHFTMGWNGNIVIRATFPDHPQDLVFKQKNFLKNLYALTDSQQQELLVIQPDFKWKTFTYDYSISTAEVVEALAFKEILLLVTIHCANYYQAMMMGGMAALIAG
jgi:hypothetical protein